jgi:hypothetical protein
MLVPNLLSVDESLTLLGARYTTGHTTSHTHYFVHNEFSNSHGIVSPAWQAGLYKNMIAAKQHKKEQETRRPSKI